MLGLVKRKESFGQDGYAVFFFGELDGNGLLYTKRSTGLVVESKNRHYPIGFFNRGGWERVFFEHVEKAQLGNALFERLSPQDLTKTANQTTLQP